MGDHMKKFLLLALVLGLGIGGYRYATASTKSSSHCSTWVSFVHIQYGNRCLYSDEVMTGIAQTNPLAVYCGRIQVNCF